jgi:serine/threonine protein kinase
VPRDGRAAVGDAQRQIVREIRVVAGFNHPNVVTYYHNFSENGLLYLVMEYCPGGSFPARNTRNENLRPVPNGSTVEVTSSTGYRTVASP